MRSFGVIVVLAVGLAGCADPLRKVDRLEDVELAPDAAEQVSLVQAQPAHGGSLFARLFKREDGADTPPVAREAEAEAAPAPTVVAEPEVPEPAATGRRWRLWPFGGGASKAPADQSAPIPDPTPVKASATDAPLSYGILRKDCDARVPKTAVEVDRDEAGRLRLYDSQSGATHPRLHYLTGLRDGCPRLFKAALAVVGTAGTRDVLSTKTPGRASKATEPAYQSIKARACKGGPKALCDDAGLRKIARNTAFVTVYERFGSSPRWGDILLHKGKVVATDLTRQ